MPDLDYTLETTEPSGETGPMEPGFIHGGLGHRSAEFDTPTVVVDGDDIDAALAEINELGGSTVSERQEVGHMGYAAYVRDTEGNLLGLWETRRHRGSGTIDGSTRHE